MSRIRSLSWIFFIIFLLSSSIVFSIVCDLRLFSIDFLFKIRKHSSELS
nr:MAG TPA: hypothetical protein [Inoviridae sp.]